MINENCKEIYNKHLIISRKSRNKAFSKRKDFSSLDDRVIQILNRLEIFFRSNPDVDKDSFFEAPYKLYDDVEYYPLEFYIKPKAVKCYIDYNKQLEVLDPDSDISIDRLKNSLLFVYNYCKNNKLQLKDYELNIEGTMPCFVSHLKSHKINFYTLHALTFSKPRLESGLLEYIFPDFHLVFRTTRNKYLSSSRMKVISTKTTEILEKKLKTN